MGHTNEKNINFLKFEKNTNHKKQFVSKKNTNKINKTVETNSELNDIFFLSLIMTAIKKCKL